jgi:hypothetical protein
MFRTNHRKTWLLASTMLACLSFAGVESSRAGEIIPSIGLSKPIEGDVDAKAYGGLALRGNLLPMIKTELAVAYREESRFNDALKIRMWPVTGSVYLQPIPMIYAGAGVGWYNITYDYAESVPLLKDETKREFGVHVGGGVQVPLAPMLGLDFNGRYVMMREQDAKLVPEKFNPDFWTASAGLAIKF